MKSAPFDYARPTTVEEATGLLAEAGGGAQILAGGQTLMPLLALRMSQPFVLVDINRIPDLDGAVADDTGIRIGAAMRQNAVIADPTLARTLPVLAHGMRHVGHHQTRTRGTIGGSIALGEPAAEMPAAAVALGAEVELASARGRRRVKAEDFYLGPYATALEPDEMLEYVRFPAWASDCVPIFHEVAQRPGDFALVGLIGAVRMAAGRITDAGLAWFGMGPTPMKARAAEAALRGQETGAIDLAALAELAIADTAPFDDAHASAAYRRAVGRRIFERTVGRALDERQAA